MSGVEKFAWNLHPGCTLQELAEGVTYKSLAARSVVAFARLDLDVLSLWLDLDGSERAIPIDVGGTVG